MYKSASRTNATNSSDQREATLPTPGKATLVQRLYAHGADAAAGARGPGNAVQASKSSDGRGVLRIGSTGPAVAELQHRLQVEADGQFGPRTRAAVVAFQQAHGLAADGIVGPLTWTALDGAATATPPAGGAGGDRTTGDAAATSTLAGEHAADAQATGEPAPEVAATTDGARAAIVAAARSKIGTVFSDVPAAADETGDHTRQGWETLTEIFRVAFPSFPKHIIKYIKHGKNNGKAGSNPNGLVSWCGIFATWAVMTGGGNCGTWDGGPRCSAMSKITRDPRPGDVGYFTANQHHCIIASVQGDQIETIDGNSYDGDSGGNGAITSRMRHRGEFAGFFKQVDD